MYYAQGRGTCLRSGNQVIQFWYLSAFSSLLNLLINECFFTHLLILNYCGIYFNMSTNAESFYIL